VVKSRTSAFDAKQIKWLYVRDQTRCKSEKMKGSKREAKYTILHDILGRPNPLRIESVKSQLGVSPWTSNIFTPIIPTRFAKAAFMARDWLSSYATIWPAEGDFR
jgi:hypothetical protein